MYHLTLKTEQIMMAARFNSTISKNVTIAKKFVLDKHFNGLPKRTDIKLVEETLPQIQNGEFLTEAVYLSVDPYIRAYQPLTKLGRVMMCLQIAKVIESNSEKFPIGTYVVGDYGWRTHTISCEKSFGEKVMGWKLPPFGTLPLSVGLGMLGLTGNTAYFGLLDICQPKANETVVVSGAAGAVGSHVGQIAKIKGCKVIGIAGSDDKGKWLTNELGFDHFINYKEPNILEKLKQFAPNKVDCYFDNVGGELSSNVMRCMNKFGRISVCGAITAYNSNPADLPKATLVQGMMAIQQLKMEGFIVTTFFPRWMEGIEQNLKWLQEGKLKYRETITDGFENTFQAFVDMLQGKNFGKALVKV
ncbi:hypothetical protein RI129_002337 [Pyrocoelia pectoralis]|uniref:Prostaglandin reductase 1 n=1 Tax=Pyrocoelia pectoralis TaxID=417401 RepID=A0AAN7VFT8_9COLE